MTTSTSRSGILVLRLVSLLSVVAVVGWRLNISWRTATDLRHLPSLKLRRPLPGGPVDSTCLGLCGNVTIPYPFGLSSECAKSPYFQLNCSFISEVEGYVEEPVTGFWPFLTANGSFTMAHDSLVHFVYSFRIISIDGNDGTLIIDTTAIKATSCDGYQPSTFGNASITLPDDGPYRLSNKNIVFVSGCYSAGQFSAAPIPAFGQTTSYGATCGPNVCNNQNIYNFCNAYDCCTMTIVTLLNIYLMGGGDPYADFPTCGFCSVLYPDTYLTDSAAMIGRGTYGLLLDFAVELPTGYPNCSSLEKSREYPCSLNATCVDIRNPVILSDLNDQNGQNNQSLVGYICQCTVAGFEGDGYLNGTNCTDIDECKEDSELNQCAPEANCTNYVGSYNCTCPSLMEGDGFRNSSGCTYIDFCKELDKCDSNAVCTSSNGSYNCTCPRGMVGDGRLRSAHGTGCQSIAHTALIAGLSVAGGLVVIVANGLLIWYLHRKRKRTYIEKLFGAPDFSRRDFLREIQSKEGANICKLFTFEELSKATNNFSIDLVLGSGGFGTVYEGTLDDGTKLAIKRAKHDVGGARDDTKQFINEVTILSQVNHRNLVKLLGCCLETPSPILIYEFISNGSLMEHLQRSKLWISGKGDVVNAGPSSLQTLDWNKRLQIAIGTAEALTYLHFGTSPPIYHRDVKTANILLDDKYVAKVADFGLSKFVPLDATHLSTAIQGTPGYLDPEYFDNYQITDKSDVYSFGVVLLELISAQKPVDLSQPAQDHNLALRCNRLLKHGRLEDIIDPVLNASSDPKLLQVIHSVTLVAMKCVEKARMDRPTMKEVVEELQVIARATRQNTANDPKENRKEKLRPFKYVNFEDDSVSFVHGMSTNSEKFYFSSEASSTSLNSSTSGNRVGDLELFPR